MQTGGRCFDEPCGITLNNFCPVTFLSLVCLQEECVQGVRILSKHHVCRLGETLKAAYKSVFPQLVACVRSCVCFASAIVTVSCLGTTKLPQFGVMISGYMMTDRSPESCAHQSMLEPIATLYVWFMPKLEICREVTSVACIAFKCILALCVVSPEATSDFSAFPLLGSSERMAWQ